MKQPPDPRYVASDRPVNLRTAARPRSAIQPVPAVLLQRVQAAQARRQLGMPLAQQVDRVASSSVARSPGLLALAGGAAALGSAALWGAVLQAAWPLAAAGAVGWLAAAALWQRGRASAEAAAPVTPPLFEPATLRSLDELLVLAVADLPPQAVHELHAIKQALAALARHGGGADEHFTLDDRLYVIECARRYLPDTLQAFLQVPREHRAAPLEGGGTAETLLCSQLALLRAQLQEREGRAARSAAGELVRQQRFLAAKSRTPHGGA